MEEAAEISAPRCRICGDPAQLRKDGLSTGFCPTCLQHRAAKARLTVMENKGKRVDVDFARFVDGEDILDWIKEQAGLNYRTIGDQIIFILKQKMDDA